MTGTLRHFHGSASRRQQHFRPSAVTSRNGGDRSSVGGSVAALLAMAIGLSPGGMAVFMTLAASASYIAVPAALRLALPEANPAISLTLSLGVTFPFNLVLGIPLYVAAATWLTGR